MVNSIEILKVLAKRAFHLYMNSETGTKLYKCVTTVNDP